VCWGFGVAGPKCGAKIVNFCAVFAFAASPSIVRGEEYFCIRCMFVSAVRSLAVGDKITRISSRTAGPGAPKEDPFWPFSVFNAACRLYCELHRYPVAGIRWSGFGLQNFYWTFFLLGGPFGSWTLGSVIFAHVPLRILSFRERQRPLLKI